MHTARSRNDQVVTDFKLWVKDSSLVLINELNSLIKTSDESLTQSLKSVTT